MFNTSTSLITYQIKDSNGTVLHEGLCPYGLLSHVQRSFLTCQDRTMEFVIGTTIHSVSRNFSNLPNMDYAVSTSSPLISSRIAYNTLVEFKENREKSETELAAYNLALEAEQEERAIREEQILQNLALQAQSMYQTTLQAQLMLSEEQNQHINQEIYRLDILRSQTVTTIAVDPLNNAVPALMSEVGRTSDVQRQIALSMLTNSEVTKVILASTATLWNTSYEITDVASRQAVDNQEIADLLASKIDPDSLLYKSLVIIGRIS